jgi:RNA polymerase sigma-70 factor, ECF subfamily
MSSDAELTRRFIDGDEEAFDALYRRHVRLVVSIAVAMTGSSEEARDLSQEVFLQVHRAVGSLRNPEAFVGWLRQITVRLCLRHRRRRDREESVEAALVASEDPARPDDLTEARDAVALLWRLLDGLDAEDRAVVVLRDIEGMSYAEIADAMGWTLAKMKTRLHRARAALARGYRQLEGE